MSSRLQARDRAPDFEVEDVFGQPISLYSKRGSLVLLSFYRQLTSPPCHFHYRVRQILRHCVTCNGRLKFIAVFESERQQVLNHIYEDCYLPFTVIADPKADLFRLYKVDIPRWQTLIAMLRTTSKTIPNVHGQALQTYEHPMIYPFNVTTDILTKRLPADFLVMADGKMEIVYYGQDESDYLPFGVLEHCLGGNIISKKP